jgi:hypothetical protein
MKRMAKLTHERLLEVLDYDPATGGFVWRVATSNRVHVGGIAGVIHKPSGGRYITIDSEKFMAHILAWFYVKGSLPIQDIRPIDGNFDHCAIANLHEVSRSSLQHKRGAQSNNTSGFIGVSRAPHGKWQAKITWNYQQVSLGMNFATAEEASTIVQAAMDDLRGAQSNEEVSAILEMLRLEKRQRAVWANLVRNGDPLGWTSFDEFANDVMDMPEHRYAMAPLDATKPIGPGNYRWASVGHALTGISAGNVQYARDNRRVNGDHVRHRRFKAEYGIDFAKYQEMLLDQKGVCAICEKPETKIQNGTIRLLSVDHDHSTGEVRGLLCANCNMAIGYACDDVTVLQKAINYLNRHKPANVIPFNGALSFGA